MKFVFITEGDVEANRKKFATKEGRIIILQDQKTRDLSKLLRAQWTPTGILMNQRGRVASFTTVGDVGMRELMGKIEKDRLFDDHVYYTGRDTRTITKIRIGEEMKPFEVKDVHGNLVNSESLKGKQTLLAFWSPTCKYCVAMLEDIKKWDATKNGVDPELVFFADGEDPEPYKEFGLKSPVIWDPDHRIGNRIGQFGSPSAIMIDEDGKFITETAVGAEDIWALIGKTTTTDG
jgi:thioredoxin-related protein